MARVIANHQIYWGHRAETDFDFTCDAFAWFFSNSVFCFICARSYRSSRTRLGTSIGNLSSCNPGLIILGGKTISQQFPLPVKWPFSTLGLFFFPHFHTSLHFDTLIVHGLCFELHWGQWFLCRLKCMRFCVLGWSPCLSTNYCKLFLDPVVFPSEKGMNCTSKVFPGSEMRRRASQLSPENRTVEETCPWSW